LRNIAELRRQWYLRSAPPVSVKVTSAEASGGDPGEVMTSMAVVAGWVPNQKRTSPLMSTLSAARSICGSSMIQDSM